MDIVGQPKPSYALQPPLIPLPFYAARLKFGIYTYTYVNVHTQLPFVLSFVLCLFALIIYIYCQVKIVWEMYGGEETSFCGFFLQLSGVFLYSLFVVYNMQINK